MAPTHIWVGAISFSIVSEQGNTSRALTPNVSTNVREVHLSANHPPMRLIALPLLSSSLLLAIATGQARAQDATEQLRPHMVHVLNADGNDEYRDDRTPTALDTTVCFIYVGRKQSGPLWLRLQVRYSAYKRVDMEKINFRKGDKQVTINVSPDLHHYGDNGMTYWEWYDTPPSDMEMGVIRAIIAEPGVELTLIGKQTITRELSEAEREAMHNVLEQASILGRGTD